MDNRTREQIIANEDRLIEEIDKQAKVIQWYEKENSHNQEIIIKDIKEIEKLHSIIKEVREYITEDMQYATGWVKVDFLEILDKVEEN